MDLPKEKWSLSPYLYLYQNFWCPSDVLPNVVWLQAHFRARDSDILLATMAQSPGLRHPPQKEAPSRVPPPPSALCQPPGAGDELGVPCSGASACPAV